MFFPKLSLPSAGFSSAKPLKKELTLQGIFTIPLPNQLTSSDFPRRVTLGESLGETEKGWAVLSPLNGIVSLSKDKKQMLLNLDGEWLSAREYKPKLTDYSEFLLKIKKLGLLHLDFRESTLHSAFDNLNNLKLETIVLSPFTAHNHLNAKELFSEQEKLGIQFLKNQFLSFFPKVKILDLLTEVVDEFSEPLGNHEYFLSKNLGISLREVRTKLADRSLLYLGPETIFHLIRALYFSIPFVKRHLIVFLMDSSGKVGSIRKEYFLSNGQSLQFLVDEYQEKYSTASFESVYDISASMDIQKLPYFQIQNHSFLILTKGKKKERSPFPCIQCLECNGICPTKANPYALILEEPGRFQREECLHCGLCTVHCPSGIDLRALINADARGVKP